MSPLPLCKVKSTESRPESQMCDRWSHEPALRSAFNRTALETIDEAFVETNRQRRFNNRGTLRHLPKKRLDPRSVCRTRERRRSPSTPVSAKTFSHAPRLGRLSARGAELSFRTRHSAAVFSHSPLRRPLSRLSTSRGAAGSCHEA